MNRQLSELIGRIYDAAVNPELWEPLMNDVSDQIHGSTGVLVLNTLNSPFKPIKKVEGTFIESEASGVLAKYTRFPQKVLDHYMAKFFLNGDVWYHKMREQGIDEKVKVGSDMITADELAQADFYREILEPTEGGHLLACFLDQAGESAFSISKCLKKPDFSIEERQFFENLIPHLRRAFTIHSHVSTAQQAAASSQEVLNNSSSGVLILDKDKKISFVNKIAEGILQRKDGFHAESGSLRISDLNDSSQFEKLVDMALETAIGNPCYPGGGMRVFRQGREKPFHVIVSPLNLRTNSPFFLDDGAVGVFIYDQEQNTTIPGEMLISLYGLTPSEAQILQLFYQGKELREIGESLNVALSTVRTHFYRVLEKTGVSSQVELMKLLCGLSGK